MKASYISFFVAIFLLFAALSAQAQRPKIGLTLSGGGAKGLAHVGILQAIDSAGLEIDYITGTSMGSIIGAMYATGYSGNQIDSIAKNLNWDDLLLGKPKYSDVGMDEKDEFGKYSFEIPMEGLKPKMGTGLIESEEVWLQFSDIFFHVYDQKDFSKFDIPFKCIATNLSNGEAVVLSSGQLVKALRSSMALPSAFTAVEYGDTYLIDGGIVRNFPVSDVIEMGADYVIGVNLFTGLDHASELNSALDVMYQITNYRDANDLVRQKAHCNIVIEPPLDGYSAGSFSDADKILSIGYEMRDKYYPYFKKLADSLNDISTNNYDPCHRLKTKKTVIIDEFEIIGLERLNKDALLQKANLLKGKSLSPEDLNDAFRKLYSTLYFKYVYYELEPSEAGHAKMIVHLKEQTPAQFKVGFSFLTFTTPALILNYTTRNVLCSKSRSMIKLALSQDFKALLEHTQFFGSGSRNSLTVSLKYIEQRVNLYNENELAYQYKTSNTGMGLRYNYYFSRASTLAVHFMYRRSGFSPNIASTLRFDGFNRDLMSKITYEVNTLNRPFLPTQGIDAKMGVGLEYARKFDSQYSGNGIITDTSLTIVAKDPLFRFDFYVNWYKAIAAKTNLLANIQGGKLFADENFYLDNFLIGGTQKLYQNLYPFVGYQDGQIPSTSFASALIGIQYKIVGELYVLGKANAGVYDFISSKGWADDIRSRFISGFNATVAYNLSMLPFELSLNYSPETNAFYSNVRIGFIF